jgi:hypothetical protein
MWVPRGGTGWRRVPRWCRPVAPVGENEKNKRKTDPGKPETPDFECARINPGRPARIARTRPGSVRAQIRDRDRRAQDCFSAVSAARAQICDEVGGPGRASGGPGPIVRRDVCTPDRFGTGPRRLGSRARGSTRAPRIVFSRFSVISAARAQICDEDRRAQDCFRRFSAVQTRIRDRIGAPRIVFSAPAQICDRIGAPRIVFARFGAFLDARPLICDKIGGPGSASGGPGPRGQRDVCIPDRFETCPGRLGSRARGGTRAPRIVFASFLAFPTDM